MQAWIRGVALALSWDPSRLTLPEPLIERQHIPAQAAMGGAKTTYPEFQQELEKLQK